MMGRQNRHFIRILASVLILGAGALLAVMAGEVRAQEDETQDEFGVVERIIISSVDTSSAPAIHIRAFGLDNQGIPQTISNETIQVRHDGQLLSEVAIVGSYKAGTFTIFVVDIPPGVEAQLPALQQSLEQYMSPPEMEEPVDYAAIYQVGESEANQLLKPSNFYNTFRNFFSAPLETQSGPTALVDSLVILLQEAENITPKEGILTTMVVMTDGTDAVSSQYDAADVGQLAAGLGIPIHTIWLENDNLQPASHDAGKSYLAQISDESGGVASQMDRPEEVQAIWERIASFRNHDVIQYQVENLTGGDHEVDVSLRSDLTIGDNATINIAQTSPTIMLDLPPEDRQLVLEDLDESIRLTFSGLTTWLDGEERELVSAQLLVNGAVNQEIDVDDVDRFKAEINNLSYGPNTIQIAIEDELGQRATSPPITLNVSATEQSIPEDEGADRTAGSQFINVILGCLIVSFLMVLLALILYLIYRRRSPEDRRQFRKSGGQPEPWPDEASQPEPQPHATTTGMPYLEVITSVTRMPPYINLSAVEHRIGRNPKEADIAFENDITVSRLHSTIHLEGSDYRLYDKGSTSGTLVNDQQVPGFGYQLVDGDEIRLGEVVLRYRLG